MKKIDAIISLVIGFLIGLFFLIILRSIGIREFLLLPIVFSFLSLLGMFIATLIGKKLKIIYQVAKFILVGALNTFVDFGVLNLLMFSTSIFSGIWYSIFKALSFLCAVINSYFWNKLWTFEKKDELLLRREEFFKFFLVSGTGFLLNVSIASFIVNVLGTQFGISKELWSNLGAFIAVICVFIWNFLGYKLIVFKK